MSEIRFSSAAPDDAVGMDGDVHWQVGEHKDTVSQMVGGTYVEQTTLAHPLTVRGTNAAGVAAWTANEVTSLDFIDSNLSTATLGLARLALPDRVHHTIAIVGATDPAGWEIPVPANSFLSGVVKVTAVDGPAVTLEYYDGDVWTPVDSLPFNLQYSGLTALRLTRTDTSATVSVVHMTVALPAP